jgi:hypothetical protein
MLHADPVSLFLCAFNIERANIVTDTLATTPEGDPCLFVTKATPVPPMRTIMVCTGIAVLGDRWAAKLRSGMLALDVEMLDTHTPGALRDLWREVRDEHGIDENTSTTVYHVGMTREGECHVYAYRSSSGFDSDRLPESGLAIKPQPIDNDGVPENLVDLAEYLREEQSAFPPAERIHIGGELFLTSISADGIGISHVHTFDDHREVWNAMNELARSD